MEGLNVGTLKLEALEYENFRVRSMMKRTRLKRTKQNPTRQRPDEVNKSGKVKNPVTRDLTPNDKVDKYADEVYGDTEIPSRG